MSNGKNTMYVSTESNLDLLQINKQEFVNLQKVPSPIENSK